MGKSVNGMFTEFLGRSIGWYCMALVERAGLHPGGNPRRDTLITILRNLSASLIDTGIKNGSFGIRWSIKEEEKGNYLEASASCMFAYAFAKGASRGLLNARYFAIAESAFTSDHGKPCHDGRAWICEPSSHVQSAGLGGHPYRDGSF